MTDKQTYRYRYADIQTQIYGHTDTDMQTYRHRYVGIQTQICRDIQNRYVDVR